MGSKGSNTTTTQTQSGPPGYIDSAYRDVISRAQGVAGTPYQAYQGQLVAGLQPNQQAAFNTIAGAQGMSQPYIDQAAQYAQQGAAPISGGDISQYLNPYQQAVTDATIANINETNAQQNQQLVGNAISRGAWGGDRAGIAQAELARQQGLSSNATLASLNQQNYNNALQAANADKMRAAQGAFTYGALGNQALTNTLQGAQAQAGAGTIEQQQQQAELASQYQQFQLAQAFPYQQTQWLAGIASGIGSNAGGTSTGTQVAPAPNQTAQYAGLGLAGAGLLGSSGAFGASGWLAPLMMMSDERVKEDIAPIGRTDDGQTIYRYRYAGQPEFHIGLLAQEVEQSHPESVGQDAAGIKYVDLKGATDGAARDGFAFGGAPEQSMGPQGFVPTLGLTQGRGVPQASFGGGGQQQQAQSPNAMAMVRDAMSLGKELKGTFGQQPTGILPDVAQTAPAGLGQVQPMGTPTGMPAIYSSGGGVAGYDEGGPVPIRPEIINSFDSRFGAANDAVSDGTFDPQGANGSFWSDQAVPQPQPVQAPPVQSPPGTTALALSAPQPTGVAQAAFPSHLIKDPPPDPSDGAMAYDDIDVSAQSRTQPQAQSAGQSQKPDVWQSITAAGLGMLASKSPFLGTAIGEGGLAGMQNYSGQKKEILDQRKTDSSIQHQRATEDISRQGMKIRAQQLKQQLEHWRATSGIQQQNANTMEQYRKDQQAERERANREREEQKKLETQMREEQKAREDQTRRDQIAAQAKPGRGLDESGNEVNGLYTYNPDTRVWDFQPGKVITKPQGDPNAPGSGGRPSAQMQMVEQVKRDAALKGETIDTVEALKRIKQKSEQQGKFRQKTEELDAKRAESYVTAAQDADIGLAAVDNIERLRKAAITAPVFGPAASALGHGPTQALTAATNKLAEASAQNLKGALSDKDLAFIQSQLPNASMTGAAGDATISMLRGAFERVKQRGLFFRQWGEKNGTLNGADAAWLRYINTDGQMTVEDPKIVGGRRFNPDYNKDFSDYINPPQAGDTRQFKQGQGVFDGKRWVPFVPDPEATP